jgi:hypothetical protein
MRPGGSGRRSRNNRNNNPRRSGGGGGGGGGGGRNQSFDSTGPDVKVRGSAQQVADKYLALARDASSSGDLVAAENYLQHAEHYQRIVNVHAERAAERAAEQQRDRPERNDEQREQREERDDRSRRDDRYGRDENEADTDTAEAVVESRQPKPVAAPVAEEAEEEGAVVESRQPAPAVARDTDDAPEPVEEVAAEEPVAKPARKPRRRTPKAAKPDDAGDSKKKEDKSETV